MVEASKHRTVAVDVDSTPEPEPRHWPWPWYLPAVVGPLAVLLGGWLVLAGLTAVGWLTSPDAELSPALRLATQVLVLAHGAPVDLGGQPVSIAPLGLTILLLFLATPLASHAVRQAARHGARPDDTGELWVDGERLMVKVGGTFGATYAAAVVALSLAMGAGSWRALVGGVVVGGIAGFWGAARGIGYDPTEAWPEWLRAVPRAMGAALLTVFAGAVVVAGLAVWSGWGRIREIAAALDGGTSGLILLIALHLLYLPNLVLACASWLLGAGLTVGDGSLITMAISDVGLLPAIPIFGAVPPSGPAPQWMLWWLAVGALAGVAAALLVAMARPRARFDETALVGGLSGTAAGLIIAALCGLGSGALGADRLSHIGARMPELLVFGPTLLGISGVIAGLVLGLIRRPVRAESVGEDDADATPEGPSA